MSYHIPYFKWKRCWYFKWIGHTYPYHPFNIDMIYLSYLEERGFRIFVVIKKIVVRKAKAITNELIHFGPVLPGGDIDLGKRQYWLRSWLGTWCHQTITWTNVDPSSVTSCIIYHIPSIECDNHAFEITATSPYEFTVFKVMRVLCARSANT